MTTTHTHTHTHTHTYTYKVTALRQGVFLQEFTIPCQPTALDAIAQAEKQVSTHYNLTPISVYYKSDVHPWLLGFEFIAKKEFAR